MESRDNFSFEIRVDGHLPEHWSEWLDGMKMQHIENHETILTGVLRDQAALYGVLLKIHNLGIELISVRRMDWNEECVND